MSNLLKKAYIFDKVAKRLTVIADYGGPGKFEVPEDHLPAIRVPKGGSSCSNCRFLFNREDGPHCSSKYYQQWAKTSELIDPVTKERVMEADAYCSDWWEGNNAS